MTSIALVDSDDRSRQTLLHWINSSLDCRCISSYGCQSEALANVASQNPEIVLLELDSPGKPSTACITELRKRLPHTPILVFSRQTEHAVVLGALRAGATGYLLKPSTRDEVLWAIGEARSGGAPMSREIGRRVVQLLQQMPTLDGHPSVKISPRENEILRLLSSGLINKQIADELGISPQTVCVHLRRIYKKLRVGTRTQAVIKYLQASSAAATQ